MIKYLLVAFLATLVVPFSLSAQTKLEDNLKAVMLLFDKNQKEAKAKIDELTQSNDEISTRNVKLSRELETAELRIQELESENLVLRSKISEGAVKEYETASLTTADLGNHQLELDADAPIPDFTPKAFKDPKKSYPNAEHLSDGALLLVNLNTATEREMRMIPGVGPAMATRITENRPYSSIWELMKLEGMGKKRIEKIQLYITVE